MQNDRFMSFEKWDPEQKFTVHLIFEPFWAVIAVQHWD